MRVVVIGATGTIGAATVSLLARQHEVVPAGRSSGLRADLTDPTTLDAVFDREPDAVVCAAAHAALVPIEQVDEEVAAEVARAKLFGQLALVARARDRLPAGGSITLTAGRFDVPVPGGSIGAVVNAGLEAFVATAAAELPRDLRINVVSPGWVTESAQRAGMTDVPSTPAAVVAAAIARCVEGTATGQVIRP
jgi:NAD(P)-dependent dehydrogenase (short-subunit alcohol dehydrogenase family)